MRTVQGGLVYLVWHRLQSKAFAIKDKMALAFFIAALVQCYMHGVLPLRNLGLNLDLQNSDPAGIFFTPN
jgi:hypothetical protein